ncbi:MAG: phosphoglycerate dehydrogenase [Zavarzinella sp.]
MARVLICDKLEQAGIRILEQAGIEVDNRTGLKGAELLAALQAADAAIVRSATRITSELLANRGKLSCVVRAGVGVDNIDVPAASRAGVVVMNTPGGNTISAAEHTIALMMSLARHIPAADASMKAGKWDRNRFLGTQVTGKTLGIIGLGRIGREVAQRATGLGMNVLGYDPLITPEKAAEFNIHACRSKEELLPKCDFLTLHIPFTPETKDFIAAKEMELLPKGARILNVARGGVVNETDLAAALLSGQLGGAGVDVFEVEPVPTDNPLFQAPNVVLTPHLGASTFEAQEAVAIEAAHLLIDFLQKGIVQCAVNLPSINRTELEQLRTSLDLAYRLGLYHNQAAQGAIRKAVLTFRGESMNTNTRLLAAAFTAGLLERYLSESVNYVNAPILARDRGIDIVTASTDARGDFANLMHTEVHTDQEISVAAGTLFGDRYPRLVQLGVYRLESYLDGILLVFPHTDEPGVIGYMGGVFGRHGVNIAGMHLGRQAPGGDAIAVMHLDNKPSQAALDEICQHKAIRSVTVVNLPQAGQMPSWLG